ncbi:MAG: hypothetical protein AABY00_00040 [Nanoarchaeota archaeon]
MTEIDGTGVATGIVFVLVGVLLLFISFFFFVIAVYGLILLVIGVIILLTLKEQDAIEQIKERKEIKRGKHRQ